MEKWLQEYLEDERNSAFQNDKLILPNRNITRIDWIPDNKYSINLSCNKLSELPTLHPYIGYLHLTNNCLTRLPLLPRRLMYLNVEGNPIQELPDLPKSLRVLRASYCALLELPSFPQRLESLYLGFNHIRVLPELPEGLDTLDIQENEIQELPYLPESLRILRLRGNPVLQNYYGKTVEQNRELVKRRIAKQRCSIFKEELMMVTWHPKRLWSWISQGLDPDDM